MELKFDCVIGIDPGKQGGIAEYRKGQVKVMKMPRELEDIRKYLKYIKSISKNPIVFLEKVQLRCDDVHGNPGKAFRIEQLLLDSQKLKDYIYVEGIPYCLVHPLSWQHFLKLVKKGEEKKERKNRYKEAAAHYYPGIKPTLWNADALLIMHFGRLKIANEPEWVTSNLPSSVLNTLDFQNDVK